MRIHKVIIRNIASLKGLHQIDFDSLQSNGNLFAITGPTGSGKSSIINAISLALYGKVYKEGSSSLDFVTMGESEGEISLYFSHQMNKYRAYWKLKVKKADGESLKVPKLTRTLFQIHPDQETALNQPIENLINLSFSQFCKTSILNQGEFSKFLKSSFLERKDLLEKFYEGEDLSRLTPSLREKINRENQKIQNLTNQIQGVASSMESIDINHEQLKTDKRELNILQNQIGHHSTIEQTQQDILFYLKKVIDLKDLADKLIIKQEMGQNVLNQRKKELKITESKLETVNKQLNTQRETLLHAIAKISDKDILLNEIQSLSKNIANQRKKLSEEHTAINQKRNQLSALSSEIDELANSYPLLLSFTEVQLNNSLLKVKQARSNLNDLVQRHTNLENQSTQMKQKITELTQTYEDLTVEKTHFHHEKTNLEIDKLQKKNEMLSQMKTQLTQSLSKKRDWDEKRKSLKTSIGKNEKELKQLFEQEKQLIQHDKLLLEKYELNELNLALHRCVQHSKEKGQCVVCGTVDLPDQLPAPELLDNIELEREKLQTKLTSLKSEISDKRLKTLTFSNECTTLAEFTKNESSQILLQWNKIEGLPYVDQVLKPESFEVIAAQMDLNQTKLKQELEKRDHGLLIDQNLNNTKEALSYVKSQATENSLQKTSVSTQLNHLSKEITQEFKNLELNFEENENLIVLQHSANYSTQYAHNMKSQKQLELLLQTHDQNLTSIKSQINEKEKALLEKTRRKDDIQSFLETNNINFDPKERLNFLETEIKNAQKQYDLAKQQHHDGEVQFAETKSRIDSQNEGIKDCKSQIMVLEAQLKEQSELALSQEKHEILESLSKHIIKLLSFDSKTEVEIIESSFKDFSSTLKDTKELVKNREIILTKNETLYNQWLEGQEKISAIEKQKQEIHRKLNDFEQLNLLIGKDEFRNYILSIIENHLIQQTNAELENLCGGRYRIIQTYKANRQLSEFKIIDHFHGAEQRKVSTLSGGETFIVSLALAMALAEMTRGQTQIDSLFIDEGFGTLDHDSLEDVLDLLREMETTGKQIGIISHVDKLTKRIPVNINLIKSSEGVSGIETIMN